MNEYYTLIFLSLRDACLVWQTEAVEAHEKAKKQAKADLKSILLAEETLSQYKIKGSEDDWKSALSGAKQQGIISVKG